MENTATFSCKIGTTDPSAPLGMEIWIDNNKIFDLPHVTETVEYKSAFSDADGEHELRFVMKNKTIDHTQIDESGNIIKDACLTLQDVVFEEIELGNMFMEKAVYTHDFNGTQDKIDDKLIAKTVEELKDLCVFEKDHPLFSDFMKELKKIHRLPHVDNNFNDLS